MFGQFFGDYFRTARAYRWLCAWYDQSVANGALHGPYDWGTSTIIDSPQGGQGLLIMRGLN